MATTARTPSPTALPDSAGEPAETRDRIDPWRVGALHATLDRPGAAPAEGDALPPMWHCLFFAEVARRSDLGPDGHPRTGGLTPDTGLPRRMRAGGRLEFLAPLPLGAEARRVSVLQNVALKQGGSGPLAIVTLRHEIFRPDGVVALREEEDLVYRPAASPGDAPRPTPPLKDDRPAFREQVTPDATLLFRYSALTFNGHRIHYDLPYAQEVEGYPGLLVHGPLMAQMLADLCRDHVARPIVRFEYRAVSPVFHDRPFTLNGRTFADRADLWVLNADGRLALEARAELG